MMDSRTESERRLMSALLAFAEGRIFVGLLIEETGFLRSSARDSPTAEDTYYREGERNVGQRVFEMAVSSGADPLRCMREHGRWCEEIALRERGLPADEEEEDLSYAERK
ncbi:hypothetical protein [Cloacibacillus porcorum]|uniref:Bbp19-like phage domain-containing protein n=1 Tax=Cloacibacillus porcorum TaxID=1197717 RepID=A0A1B2I2L8_9BACT|nr:hypothetical protein [Cloacibacillus porcorum]ANZ44214.1 hypothetical protein BED41_03385 [Cloacibacillus porcorum]